MYETHGTECHFFHTPDSFLRKVARGIPVIGTAVGLVDALQGGVSQGCGGGMVLRNGRCVPTGPPAGPPRFTGSNAGQGLGGGTTTIVPLPNIDRAVISPAERSLMATAVMGQWGAALVPEQVGTVRRGDGSVGALLRCIRGMVLGTDDLCYNKPLANGKRKWPRPTAPFLSGGDVKCIRKSIRLRKSKSNKRLLRELGMG